MLTNTKGAVVYGAVGGVLGYAISHLMKAGKKTNMFLIVGGVVLGAYMGNKSTM
jgi:hypothetical protein